MTVAEKQKNVIHDCHRIYDYYISLKKMDWELWWNRTEPYMENKYGGDPDIDEFMRYRFRDLFRELCVMTSDRQWPIEKGHNKYEGN